MPLSANTSLAALTARECSSSNRLICTLSSKFSPSSICIFKLYAPATVKTRPARVCRNQFILASAVTKITLWLGGEARCDAIERGDEERPREGTG